MPTQSTQIFLGSTPIPFYYVGDTQVGANPASVPAFPLDGLIYAFDATNPLSYPGSGSVWFDLSANKITSNTFSGSTFPTFNSASKEFVFNGTNNALMASITSSIGTGSVIRDFTQIIWVKTINSGSQAASGIVNLQNGATAVTFDAISFNESTDVWRLTSDNNNRNVTSTTTETVFNSYHMITATRETGSGNFIIWRDGANIIASGSFTPQTYSTSVSTIYSSMGNRFFNPAVPGWSTDGYISCSLSSVLLYNRVLSGDEINQIYNAGRTGISINQ